MKMVKMIALCACPYGVGVVPKGQPFDAEERHVKLLQGLKRARVADEEPAVATGVRPPVDAAVAPSPEIPPTAGGEHVGAANAADSDEPKAPAATAEALEQPKGRRTYRRQDLRAEK
jgi:hypothetical protein